MLRKDTGAADLFLRANMATDTKARLSTMASNLRATDWPILRESILTRHMVTQATSTDIRLRAHLSCLQSG